MTKDEATKIFSHIAHFYRVLPQLQPVKDWHGTVNTTWFIDNQFVLTVFRNKNYEQCKCLADILTQDDTGYLPRIIESIDGKVSMYQGDPVILYKKIDGEHFVDLDHSLKKPIPEKAHPSIANSFWQINKFLSRQTPTAIALGRMDYLSSMKTAQDALRTKPLPNHLNLDFIAEYLAAETLSLSHGSLVHTDMERHNLLHSQDGTVTGVVDVDAIMQGDLLYEYAHLMMNFAFTDPNYKHIYADAYMHAMSNSWIAEKEVISILPKLLRLFAAEDLIYYYNRAGQTPTNLENLATVYKQGVERANAYFKV